MMSTWTSSRFTKRGIQMSWPAFCKAGSWNCSSAPKPFVLSCSFHIRSPQCVFLHPDINASWTSGGMAFMIYLNIPLVILPCKSQVWSFVSSSPLSNAPLLMQSLLTFFFSASCVAVPTLIGSDLRMQKMHWRIVGKPLQPKWNISKP